jgi:hypothetical protein
MTPSGIKPETFRFVAQYLNHCATISGPQFLLVKKIHKKATWILIFNIRFRSINIFSYAFIDVDRQTLPIANTTFHITQEHY